MNHVETYLNADQTLRIVEWANRAPAKDGFDSLLIDLAERDYQMAHSVATGDSLLSNGRLGADVIRVPAGRGFAPHTHPGDHLLIVLGGNGTITYDGRIYPTQAGQIYLVEGAKPHAVGAITDHVILAVGAPHRAVDSPDRMALVEYQAITAELGSLTCLICQKEAIYPARLHEKKCPHCPCVDCV